ncbi:MAG: glutamate--tRNA ligase [Bacteroidia bacterium]|nr:glutamate--tRNA ligase [Bacteroidia bacterium]
MSSRKVRVRFAPSPTGTLHIGGVRTALYNYLFAHHHQGEFILRIEDTDQTRFVPGAEDYIMESLRWLGIEPSESPLHGGPHAPYRQSERKPLYRKYVDQLLDSGHAYYAFDTPEELDEMRQRLSAAKVASPQYNAITRHNMKNSLTLADDEVKRKLDNNEPYVVRIKLPRQEEVRFFDNIRGWIVVHTQNMDDKVLFKSDGMPTYHMANVVDDYLMQITHVIRGEEWLPSAPLHVLLYRYLGWEEQMPQFAHLPLILKPDGNGKLSKRDGDRLGFPVAPLDWKDPHTGDTTSGYREKGYFPEAVLNFLALLGWNPGTQQELFSLDELVQAFSLERVSKAGAKFDFEKAKWVNQQYLWKQSNDQLANDFGKLLQSAGIAFEPQKLLRIVALVKERSYFVNDFLTQAAFFFNDPTQYDEAVLAKRWNEQSAGILSGWKNSLAATEPFLAADIELASKTYLEQAGIPIGQVLQLFRVMITGAAAGPGMFEICELLGKETVIKRLENGISHQSK